MKYGSRIVTFAAVCMLLSLSAFARQKDKDAGNFTLYDAAHIGSTQLTPGQYKAEWTGSNSDLQVNILKNKQVVAKTQGKLVPSTNQDAVVVNDNSKNLEQIDFGKLKEALVLNPAGQ
jgi:hypothetical protein